MRGLFYLLLLLTSMLWGGNFVAGTFLVGHASVITLTNMRWGISVICLIPLVWVKDRRLLPPKRALLPLFMMGLTGVALFNIFMFMALERTTADNVGLLSALNPVAIAVVSFFVLKERLGPKQLLGMAISLFGVVVVITQGQVERLLHLQFNTGDLFMLLAVTCWGLYSVAGKKAMQHVSPWMSTLWQGVFGVVILLPFNLSDLSVKHATGPFWVATLYVSLGATVLATVLWNLGVHHIGGTKSGMFLNFNPIFTALISFILIHEKMSLLQMVGTAVVIAGVYLFTSSATGTRRVPDFGQQANTGESTGS
ncbi:DMT family transporter [Alicyclobacillus tolerans]|uniref:DMT family transporter n=1 Tax=Alicyclobacillus tolerans TaxID=90970 RepID=UPI001F2E87F1|nr:DMT family transporter [Alicyclobacillus tolerans]MCF8566441.1 DMT family transporter [Alicyclobacillus tolerans]